jgi:beta-lactamase regulating signal transducer with metallopeptidase domain/protocatechuate 3,4-dioxygenase beta subunit
MFPLDLLGEPVWQRLTWTLLHFLWQGLAVAALVAMFLYVWPVGQAHNRYLIYLSSLIAMAACLLVTFMVIEVPESATVASLETETEIEVVVPVAPAPGPDSIAIEMPVGSTGPTVRVSQPPLERSVVAASETGDSASLSVPVTPETKLRQYIDAIQPYVLVVWLAGVLLLAVRLSLSWLHVRWLARGRRVIPADLAAKAALLGKRLGLRFPPRVCVSEKIREAIVVGLWRPLVLLPASWLTEMTPEVLEAVIAHELSHIRRLDLWVNLLQRLMETLLFYHPAVWWLSRRVGLEREMCADELAVGATNERLAYATALEQLGRMRLGQTTPQFGAGIGGNRMVLLNRVGNILGSSPSNKRARWWPVGLLALAVPLAIWLAPTSVFSSTENETRAEEVADDAADTSPSEKPAKADLKIEARVVGVGGNTPQRCSITFWKAVDPEAVEKTVETPVASRFSIPHVWHDPVTGKTWQPIHNFGAKDSATKEELSPGDYRVTASIGHGDPTMVGVSDLIRLDGSREHTVVTLPMEAGPSLTIDIIKAKTEEPIEYAAIRLIRPDGLPVVSWSSGAWSVLLRENQHKFEHLAPGDYTLEVFKRAYQYGQNEYAAEQMPMNVRLAVNEDQQLTVKLKAVGPSEEEARRRWPWSVTGTVTDEKGQPLEGVEIRASCGMGSLLPTGSTRSDDQGRYTLRFGPGMRTRNESTGTWGAGLQAATIYASKPDHTEKNLCRQGGLMMADDLPPKDNSWDAKPSEIVLPHKAHSLDFVMVPSAAIEGQLVDEQGEPIADKRVSVHGKQMLPSTSVLAQGKTDKQGRFRFEGIPANYAWWFDIQDQGRTQPVRFPVSGSYRVKMQSVNDTRYNLNTVRITGVTGPRGAEVRDRVVGNDPSARPPVSDELQEQGREYLRKMAAACRDWIGPPSAAVKNYEYRFQLGDQPPETIQVKEPSRAGRTVRQGIHYLGTPHVLAARPEKVVFRQVEMDGETIRLRFLVQDGVKIAAGNGITGRFRGFFSSPLREGMLVLDKRTFRPLRTEIGDDLRETFSRYVSLGEGRSAPLRIQIKRGSSHWDWKFRVYQPGLWLLAESRSGDQLLLTNDEVKVNGQSAVPMPRDGASDKPVEIVAAENTGAAEPDTEGKKDSAKRIAAPSRTTVRGKVVDDATGEPVANFFTQGGKFDPADPAEVVWGYSETRSSRKDGKFSATVRWSEGWTARIVAAGYLAQPVLTRPPSPGQDVIEVVIRLKRGDTICGRVLDHTGQPVAKAGVYLAGRGVIGLVEGPWNELQGPSVRTDAGGRFEIGGRGKDSKAIFVAAPSLYVWRADLPEPGQEAIIRLPEPAKLHIRYEIEGGPPAAQVRIELRTWDMPKWKALVDVVRWVDVKPGNDGFVVGNLPPGIYDISRIKHTKAGNSGKNIMLDRQLKLTLVSGKTTAYDFVRKTGTPIGGEVVGLPKEGVNGVYVSIRDQQASGDPRNRDDWKLRTFDGLALEGNGPFKTERIPPGKYKVVVEAYKQETREEMSRSGWRLPKWTAAADVDVPESGAPPKVRVIMRPRDAVGVRSKYPADVEAPWKYGLHARQQHESRTTFER